MLPLRDSQPAKIFPFWVVAIVLANIIVFFLELTAPNLDAFIAQYALIPAKVNFFELETLKPFLTSQFLHGGFLHIASNMWFLWIFGDNIEEKLGFFFFPLFYLLAGTVGGLAQYILVPDSTLPMLGASGAVAGVLGAYFSFFPKHKIDTLIPVFGFPAVMPIPASVMLFYWFFLQLFNGTATVIAGSAAFGGIAWFAHIGGFATGWFIGHHWGNDRKGKEAEEGEII